MVRADVVQLVRQPVPFGAGGLSRSCSARVSRCFVICRSRSQCRRPAPRAETIRYMLTAVSHSWRKVPPNPLFIAIGSSCTTAVTAVAPRLTVQSLSVVTEKSVIRTASPDTEATVSGGVRSCTSTDTTRMPPRAWSGARVRRASATVVNAVADRATIHSVTPGGFSSVGTVKHHRTNCVTANRPGRSRPRILPIGATVRPGAEPYVAGIPYLTRARPCSPGG
ncbi:hypothetical protein SHIRM173S_06600 [Streptomyces hirsutus]